MRKRHGVFFGFAVLLITAIFTWVGCGSNGGGSDDDSIIKISTAEQFNAIRNQLDGHYVLEADIDLSGYDQWIPVGRFIPISDQEEDMETPTKALAFTGIFDGNGHTISNVSVNIGEDWGAGLFGCVIGNPYIPSIKNLTVENVDVIGGCMVGGVVGYLFPGNISDVNLIGDNTITGSIGGIGGVVGLGYGAITDCRAQATVVSVRDNVQGIGVLAGGLKNCTITGCSASGTTIADEFGNYSIGGLAGCLQDSDKADNCSADVIIIAGESSIMIGGLFGHVGNYDKENPELISNCSVNAQVTVSSSSKRVGGLIGGNFFIEEFRSELPEPSVYAVVNCNTTGTITGGSSEIGSIVGYGYDSTVDNCESDLTWNGNQLAQVGKMQSSGEAPEAINLPAID